MTTPDVPPAEGTAAPSEVTAPSEVALASEAAAPSEVAVALAAAVDALGGEHREGQLAMAEAVAATFGGAGHLLVQAGTGTGKSLAYLVPAALHATNPDRRVVVATATLALQHQLVSRDLPRLVDSLEPVLKRRPTYAVLKGRHNYVCLDRLNRGAGDREDSDDDALFAAPTTVLGRQAKNLREWVDETETGDRDDLPFPVDGRVWRGVSVSGRECVGAQKCVYGEECFAEAARARANAAQIVITNHAMLAIHTLDNVPVLPEHDAVVVDEGHELVDRATAAVTNELSAAMIERAASRTRRLVDADLSERLESAGEALGIELAVRAEGLTGPVRVDRVEGGLLLALAAVRDTTHAAITKLGSDTSSRDDPEALAAKSRARGLLGEVHDVAGELLALDETDVAWLDPGDRRSPTLRVAPLEVAGLLRSSLFDASRVVVTSATMQLGGSFEPVARSFGLPVDGTTSAEGAWTGLDVGSPFDHARQGILYVATSVPPPGRGGTDDAAMDELADLIAAAGGRTLALFSSWRGVEKAAEHLAQVLPDRLLDRQIVPLDVPVLVQKRGDSVADLVSRFASDPRSVLLGTLSLWQGVDVPGEACHLVVIDRIPFPRPDDPLVAARSKYAEDHGGNGFTAVSVPRAALLLAQGVGRLIRSSTDRGVVAVLDPRLATARYGDYLRRSLPPFWFTTDGALVRQSLQRLDELTVEATKPATKKKAKKPAATTQPED
ncbi:MAG: ATP-dependent DNA helicase [Actinomycetales bacterium]|nr:ATP-dependent DNA helicase [Actinomycetales bacterium]